MPGMTASGRSQSRMFSKTCTYAGSFADDRQPVCFIVVLTSNRPPEHDTEVEWHQSSCLSELGCPAMCNQLPPEEERIDGEESHTFFPQVVGNVSFLSWCLASYPQSDPGRRSVTDGTT